MARMNNIAENFNAPEYIPNPDLRNALENQVNELNINFKVIQESDTRWTDDPSGPNLYFRQEAAALSYITRPKEPEFWKMVDSYDHATGEVSTDHAVQDKIQAGTDAIKEIRDEGLREKQHDQGALSAMAHVYDMNIKSDIIDEDLKSYQVHVRGMQDWSQQFANALREDTGFIESPGYEEPLFPQWADQSGSYIASVNDKLRELNLREEIDTDHYKAISFMVQKYVEANHRIILTDAKTRDYEINRMMLTGQPDTLRGIRILMRPCHNGYPPFLNQPFGV